MSGNYEKLADILKNDLLSVTDTLIREGILSLIKIAEERNITVYRYERPLSAKLKFACDNSSSLQTIKFFAQALISHCDGDKDSFNSEYWYYTYDGLGEGPIWHALWNPSTTLEIIQYLVQAGFAIDHYHSALSMIWRNGSVGRLPILKYLIENGASTDYGVGGEVYINAPDSESREYIKMILKGTGDYVAQNFRELDNIRKERFQEDIENDQIMEMVKWMK